MHNALILDIETAVLPEDQLVFPDFKAPANYKDPAKIQAAIDEKKAEFLAGAALSATSGFVCAVGIMELDGYPATPEEWDFQAFLHPTTEMKIITSLWNRLLRPRPLVTFYGKNFDLPFLIRRSWILGLSVPDWLREGRYWSRDIIDLFEDWQLGTRDTGASLDVVSKAVLRRGKTGDGAQFWATLQSDRKAAVEYLHSDCTLTRDLFIRFHPEFRAP